MIFENIKDFTNSCKKNKRLLALDVGTKNIGVAVSDKSWFLSSSKDTIKRQSNEKDMNIIYNICKNENITGIIIGLPLNLKDEETNCSKFIRKFTDILDEKINLPIFFINEILTSFEAESLLIDDLNVSCKKTKQVVDKLAAYFILNDFLNKVKLII